VTTRSAIAVAALALACSAAPAGAAPGPDPDDLRTHLPLLEIRTEGRIVDEPKVDGRMRAVAGPPPNRLADRAGLVSAVGVEVRGTSSMAYPKQGLGVETRDRGGRDRPVALLGLPPAADWVLHGPYGDKTLLRNALAHAAARAIGVEAGRTRLVELVVNRDYRGVYLLTPAPRARGRGATLLELTDRYKLKAGDAWFPSATGQAVVIGDAGPGDEDAAGRSARARVAALEAALAAGDGSWRRHLDERSAVGMVLLQELLKNEDAFRSSLYVRAPAHGRLRLGPAWDFDISSGNADYGDARTLEGWVTPGRPWAEALWRDPAFVRALADRWRALRARGLDAWLQAEVRRGTSRLGRAAGRNFARWPVLGRIVWPNPPDPATGRARPTHAAEVAHLSDWLRRRVAWIDANVPGGTP